MQKFDFGGFFTVLVALAHGVPTPSLTQFGGWKKMTEREIAIDTPEFEKLTMACVSRRLHTLILFMLKWNLNFAKVLPAINYISPFFPRYSIGNCPQKVCNQKMIQMYTIHTYMYSKRFRFASSLSLIFFAKKWLKFRNFIWKASM